MRGYSSYPHPVVGNRNDVDVRLELVEPLYKPAAREVYVRATVQTDDGQVRELIESGTAAIAVTWDSPATMARGMAPCSTKPTPYGWEFSFYLAQEDIKGDVSIDVNLIASRDITGFKWDHQHPAYGDSNFDILRGDVLAVLGGFTFEARKLYDAMQPPLGSLFRVFVGKESRPLTVEYSHKEQIHVQLSAEFADGINALGSGRFDETKLSLVVLPVLVDTVNLMSRAIDGDQDDYQTYPWFTALEDLIHKSGLDVHESLTTAQALLSNSSIKSVQELLDPEGEDE